jgi:hypothetical protein
VNPTTDDARNLHCDAIHEAAHAAVGVAVGRRIKCVGLLPYGERAGYCEFEEGDETGEAVWQAKVESGDLETILDEIAVLRAGRLAEIKAGHIGWSAGAAPDNFRAQKVATYAGMDRIGPTLADGEARTRELLENPKNWTGVLRLASELIRAGRISGDDVHKILAGG